MSSPNNRTLTLSQAELETYQKQLQPDKPILTSLVSMFQKDLLEKLEF